MNRGRGFLATVAAVTGLLVLAADAVAHDPAAFLAGVTLLMLAVTLYFLALANPPMAAEQGEGVRWGTLFVGLVYASLTGFFLVTFARTPEIVHALHLAVMPYLH